MTNLIPSKIKTHNPAKVQRTEFKEKWSYSIYVGANFSITVVCGNITSNYTV